jgi:hypothetical protein
LQKAALSRLPAHSLLVFEQGQLMAFAQWQVLLAGCQRESSLFRLWCNVFLFQVVCTPNTPLSACRIGRKNGNHHLLVLYMKGTAYYFSFSPKILSYPNLLAA